jgi:hypothetical protein
MGGPIKLEVKMLYTLAVITTGVLRVTGLVGMEKVVVETLPGGGGRTPPTNPQGGV